MYYANILFYNAWLLKVRAGVEMALIDAVASDIGIPLWRLFGGVSNTITTDITVEFLFE